MTGKGLSTQRKPHIFGEMLAMDAAAVAALEAAGVSGSAPEM